MKKYKRYFLLFVFSFLIFIPNSLAERVTIKKRSDTQGGVTFNPKLTCKDTLGCNQSKAPSSALLSAMTYKTDKEKDAYCLQSEKLGPGQDGMIYECDQTIEVNQTAQCIIKTGLQKSYSQQIIEYAIKLYASNSGISTGFIRHNGLRENYGQVYKILSNNIGNYKDIILEDNSQVFETAANLFRDCKKNKSSVESEKKEVNLTQLEKPNCKNSNCTMKLKLELINFDEEKDKVTNITASNGEVSGSFTNNSTITVSSIKASKGNKEGDNCFQTSITVEYETEDNEPILCEPLNTNYQLMIILSGDVKTKDFLFSFGDCKTCEIKKTEPGCNDKIELDELQDNGSYHDCIIGTVGCDGVDHDDNLTDGNWYCTISCKEEDVFDPLPTNIIGKTHINSDNLLGKMNDVVFSGRYFNLNTELGEQKTFGDLLDYTVQTTGTKTCVTSGGTKDYDIAKINWQQFCKDVYGNENCSPMNSKSYSADAPNYNYQYGYWHNMKSSCIAEEKNIKTKDMVSSISCSDKTEEYDEETGEKHVVEHCDPVQTTTNHTYSAWLGELVTVGKGSYIAATFNTEPVSCIEYSCKGCTLVHDDECTVKAMKDIILEKLEACDGAQGKYEAAFKNLKIAYSYIYTCNNFKTKVGGNGIKYKYDPEISFSYPEKYDIEYTKECLENCEDQIEGEGKFTDSLSGSKPDFSNVDSDNIAEQKGYYHRCTDNSTAACEVNAIEDVWYKNTAAMYDYKRSYGWKLSSHFMTNIPSGSVTEYNPGSFNTIDIGNVYPISINTGKGTYKFTISLTNVGENAKFDKQSCVVDLKNSQTCEYEVTSEVVTPYCPDCPKPTPPFPPSPCENGDCDDIKKEGINYFYRPIYLENIFPNSSQTSVNKLNLSRTIGSNWLNEKGLATMGEIQRAGDDLYNNDGTNGNVDVTKDNLEYSYTINPRQMANIREYNSQREKDGMGYADFNLECISEEESANIAPQGFRCRSKFLNGTEINCTKNNCFTDNLNQESLQRNITFIEYIDENGTVSAWK